MIEHYKNCKNKWHSALSNYYFAFEFLISISILVFTLLTFSKFTEFVELRKGVQFHDPFLDTFKAVNLNGTIFSMIYGGIVFALALLIPSPFKLMILFESYALMVLTRVAMMFILPLAPPAGIIFLHDPFVEFFGTGKTLINDLFFSGHTATLFLLYLTAPKKLKGFFLLITIFVATCVLLQKVHYTVDVLVAPYVSFCCYKLILSFFCRRYKNKNIKYDLD